MSDIPDWLDRWFQSQSPQTHSVFVPDMGWVDNPYFELPEVECIVLTQEKMARLFGKETS